MNQQSAYKDVAQFMEMSNQPVLTTPQIPSKERCELRVRLIEEELKELKEAIAAGNVVEVADALTDLKYVIIGAAHEFGLGNKMKACWDEVQRSNMSKMCINRATAEEAKLRWEEVGTKCHIHPSGLGFVLNRVSDGKLLKPYTYSPADLKSIVEAEVVE